MIRINNRAFIANWSELGRWDTNSLFAVAWAWPEEILKPLSEAVVRQIEPVETQQGTREIPIIQKISFGGRLTVREEEQRHNYKGKLFWAYPGNLVYSKIRVKQGSVAIVPEGLPQVAVSNEYPVYRIRPEIALPIYLTLVLRSSAFKQLLDGLSNGGSSKTRVAANTLENLTVPLPPLPVQTAIVEAYETGVAEAARLRQEAARLEAAAATDFLSLLGIENTYRPARAKLQLLSWSKLERWSVEAAHEALYGNGQPTSTLFHMATIGEVGAVSYGIQKAPTNRPGTHPHPYLRVANVKAGYLDLTEIKYINVPDAQFPLFEVLPGDLLFVEGNGSRTELGRAALWNGKIDGCVHQNHLLKVRFDQEKVLPAFASRWFNTETGRGHFFRSAKTSSGLGTINSKEMRLAPIPLPPLETQQQILQQDALLRSQAAALRTLAAETEAAAVARVEAMILGTH